jgi:hypothetical protein
MQWRAWLAQPWPYLGWLLLSLAWLLVARAIDPYVFGFSAFGTAGISGLLLFVALWFGWRAVLAALVAAIPTVLAFALLSTYKWAGPAGLSPPSAGSMSVTTRA